MKKISLLFVLLLAAISSKATVTFSVQDMKCKLGDKGEFTIDVSNDAAFSGLELQIYLPEGAVLRGSKVEIVRDRLPEKITYEDDWGDIVEESTNWGVSGATQADGSYKISLSSTKGYTIEPGEGALLKVLYGVQNTATIGEKEIRLGAIAYSQKIEGTPTLFNVEDVTAKINVYKEFTVTATSADETMGTVTGGGAIESGTETTVTATANEGYHFVNWTSGETEISTDAEFSFLVSADSTLTANFEINQYKMTFVLDNGEEDVVKTQDYASELTAPANIEKTGFTFIGWNPEVPDTIPASDQTFTAQWERNNYKVTWVVDGVSTDSTVAYEGIINKPADPSKDGYTFTGWTPAVSESMPAENLTYTAQFEINQYKMTFVLDNGENNVVKTQDYASELTAPADVQKTGFTFKGWSPEVPGTVPAGDQTFTAQWERNNYKVTWVVDGVSTDSTVAYEGIINKPADPSKEGYTFTGWTPAVSESMPAENLTYTAQFEINQYKMTFVLDNGENNVVKTQDYASELTAPADVQKTGFTFKGWSPEVPGTVPAGDQTFTAQWERNNYKITWVVDGVLTDSTVAYEGIINKPEDPFKEGYTFTGWTPAVSESMPAENLTYTAQFEINQYKMTFVLDNGENNVVKTQDYASELTAPADVQKTGFTFKGWSPEVPGTVPAGDQTFTAQWERNNYKVTWVVDGVSTDSTVAYEGIINKPADPSKEGYTFTGWTPAVSESMPAENLTYTAQFEINQYKMTFVLDNGENNVVKTQDYASELTAPADVQKTGFTFKGWSPEVPGTVPAGDQTFTAQWERNNYKVTWVVDGVSTDSIAAYEAAINKPEDPSKDGYTFTGWSPAVAATMPAENLTYTAQFSINQYKMTFVLDNGENNVVKTQDYASELTAPADVQKTGFTFTGWSPEVPGTVPAGDQTFTAQWERNNYKVTWVVDGVSTDSTVAYEGIINKPADPSKEGYTFTGWTPAVSESMPAENLTYTAQFEINQYKMTFVLDNGENNVVKTQDYASELTAPADVQKTGFTFKGWSPEVPGTVPAGDQTFTAQWERNNYKVTWVVDGVSTDSTVAYEGAINKPADPSKKGYTFTGWTPAVAATMPAENLTYTAQFSIEQYTITFDLAGGELAEGDSNPESYTVESENITLATPAREGYNFEGWIGTDLAEPTLGVTIFKGSTGDRSYTATWSVATSVGSKLLDSKVDVYDLRGQKIRSNVPASEASEELPNGIYIIGGKKVSIMK